MAHQLVAGLDDTSARQRSGERGIRRLSPSVASFTILATAFAISTAYQLYRASIMEIPDDAFTVTTALGYAAMVGVSALILTNSRWAWWVVSVFVAGLFGYGTFSYFPNVTTARDMGPIDWLEATVFMGMLAIAGFICAMELFGLRLVASEGSESNNA